MILLYNECISKYTNVWGWQKSYNLHVLGQNTRSLIVETTVASPSIDNYYKILGGKTRNSWFYKKISSDYIYK